MSQKITQKILSVEEALERICNHFSAPIVADLAALSIVTSLYA